VEKSPRDDNNEQQRVSSRFRQREYTTTKGSKMTTVADTLFPLDEIPQRPRTRHPQVLIEHGSLTAAIDEAIADLILELWRADLATLMSCQDSPTGWIWILLPTASTHRLLDIISSASGPQGEDLARRALQQWVPLDAPQGSGSQPAWRYDTERWSHRRGRRVDVVDYTSVRFPTADYPPVLHTLRTHNATPASHA
jgi:hypothetical protein